jgi:glucose/arabinose dehydrogenase
MNLTNRNCLALLAVLLTMPVSLTMAQRANPGNATDTRPFSPAVAISSQVVYRGFTQPVYLTSHGPDRIFVVEHTGRIRLIDHGKLLPTPYLDIHDHVTDDAELGLQSVAFKPDFDKSGKLFVYYSADTRGLTHSVLAEFTANPTANTVDPATERILLQIPKPYPNHNGGQLQFGPDDGYLYLGTGDGGLAGDPQNRAQNPGELLGKFLRIDVSSKQGYEVPKDNPFVGKPEYRPEIWTMGMRNPWRFSFDRLTHALWCADVGQDKWEEIDVITKGGNYGWHIIEGTHPYNNKDLRPTSTLATLIPPLKEYPHFPNRNDMPDSNVIGNCIIGGYVYRGKAIPDLNGWYIYGDYQSGFIAGLRYENGKVTGDSKLLQTNIPISSFGEDDAGELYICDFNRGNISKIMPVTATTKPAT